MKYGKEQRGIFTFVQLENTAGLSVELLSFGACMKSVSIPVDGVRRGLSLSFDALEEYTVRSTGNSGKTLAPNAGEISEEIGILLSDGSEIHPAANRNGNSLHGGPHAGNLQNWTLTGCGADDETAYAEFALDLEDGLDGWPGNRTFTVRYTLNESSALTIDLSAKTDKPTYINMSNHAYWNLEFDPAHAMEQRFSIDAESMCYNDSRSLPSVCVPCEDIFGENGIDFTAKNTIGDFLPPRAGAFGHQVEMGGGIDNAFMLRKGRDLNKPACTLESRNEKIRLELYTDAPSIVVYQAGGMKADILLRSGFHTKKNCAIALEAQEIPNLSPVTPLSPDSEFARRICYKISWM